MTFLDAALRVLADEGRPLRTREIFELATARRLISTTGQTPERTMTSALYAAHASGKYPLLLKAEVTGATRAVRGSVRWEYVDEEVREMGGHATPR